MKGKTIVFVLLAGLLALLVVLFLASVIAASGTGRIPSSPLDYMNSVWVCEEPYMRFEACHDEWGYIGIGEAKTGDGETIPVRFCFELGRGCDIYKEDAFWEIGEDGKPHITGPLKDPLMRCSYKMRKKDTVMVLTIAPGDTLYHDEYTTLTFYRQDPAGTEESAAQP